ncbi:kinase-like domain-containing protein [Rhizophagus clarus]|uniref:Kinase-like domain-containing protein n=1 Tax=Rhizophagus clarus TaxID=94130 RepID=A0A8H3LSX6_9GLOM|nr:kinase-like domain-containing protein [Rhizophagus clarus]
MSFKEISTYLFSFIFPLVYHNLRNNESTDYNLSLDERRKKYKDYRYILCEKCKQKIDMQDYYCLNCYYNETDNYKRYCNYVLCEKCKHEVNKRDYKCNGCYIMETDPEEKIRMRLGCCKECHQVNKNSIIGCVSCIIGHFKDDFDKWTSGNKDIDKLIQDDQLSFNSYSELLEWIPYNKFEKIKYIAKGGFSGVYSATWTDGQIKRWNPLSKNWERNGLRNKDCFKKVFIKACYYPGILKCFGITQVPGSFNYALVLEYMKDDLRSYLKKNYNSITWGQKLMIIKSICYGLHVIHDLELIHKDLHPGNVLIHDNILISDFGFCVLANKPPTNKNVYGVMPYMAPEILREQQHTLASDIYSLGIIMNEIITITPPFNNHPHDHFLVLDICQGLRPDTIITEIPNSLNFLKELKDLIERCWDANPKNRPTSREVCDIYLDILNNYTIQRQVEHSFDEYINTIINSSSTMGIHSEAIYTSRTLDLSPADLPEPTNYISSEEFISSRIVVQDMQTNERSECLDCMIK